MADLINDKPIIRHCRNCQYARHKDFAGGIECMVRYITMYEKQQRRKALRCRYYNQRKEADT